MRKILFSILVLCMSTFAFAQKKATVHFSETIKLEIKVDGMPDDMLANLPKEEHQKKLLIFNEQSAIFKNVDNQTPTNIEREQDGARFVIRRDIPDNKTFIDLKTMKCYDQKEFMTKKFLIESDLKDFKWKMTGNQKEILGYACQEAELINSYNNNKVKVWFAPQIAIGIGPLGLGNLPGLILEVNINDGKSILLAEKIEWDTVDEKALIKPTEGKKVSKKEFEEIAEAKRKEMQEQYGGDGNVIIKIRNN